MAKSRLEPNKIVRYAESSIPKNGISTRPAPTVKPSPAAAKAAVQAVVAAPAPPAPTPPAPTPPVEVPNFSSSFSFDGATELTGSYSQFGSRSIYMGSVHTTIAPGWTQEETGSFTIFSISNENTPDDYRRTFAIERTSGSNGYKDFLVCSISSGSVFYTYKGELDLSPNFYSGSGGTNEEQFFQFGFIKGQLYPHRINGEIKSYKSTNVDYQGSVQSLSNLALQTGVHIVSVGGLHATPSNYFKGTIANLSLAKGSMYYFKGDGIGDKAETNGSIDMLYRFEGNVLDLRGGQNLEVVGTETYVSSSL